MQKYSSTFITRVCSLAVTLALVLSMAVVPASAVNASIKDMNPTDDPLLGTQFAVDAVIPLVSTGEGKDISVTIPVQGAARTRWRRPLPPGRSASPSTATRPARTSTRSSIPTSMTAAHWSSGRPRKTASRSSPTCSSPQVRQTVPSY